MVITIYTWAHTWTWSLAFPTMRGLEYWNGVSVGGWREMFAKSCASRYVVITSYRSAGVVSSCSVHCCPLRRQHRQWETHSLVKFTTYVHIIKGNYYNVIHINGFTGLDSIPCRTFANECRFSRGITICNKLCDFYSTSYIYGYISPATHSSIRWFIISIVGGHCCCLALCRTRNLSVYLFHMWK